MSVSWAASQRQGRIPEVGGGLFNRGAAAAAALGEAPATATSGWKNGEGSTAYRSGAAARPNERRMGDPGSASSAYVPESVPPTAGSSYGVASSALGGGASIVGLTRRIEELERNSGSAGIDALRAEMREDMAQFQAELSRELDIDLVEFRKSAIVPLELELRDKLDNTVAPLKLTMDRALLDFEQHFTELEHTMDTGHASLQTQLDSSPLQSLIQTVQVEQQDHAEAIGNLMDLLERTATQDSVAQAADALAADVDTVSEQVEGSLNRVDEAMGELEERLKALEAGFGQIEADTAATIDARMAEIGDELTAGMDVSLQQSADEMAAVQSKLEKEVSEVTVSMTSMEHGLQDHVHDLGSRLKAVEDSTSETVDTVNSHGTRVMKMSAALEALDAKVESTSQVLDQKVELTAEEMDRQLAATKVSLETSLAKHSRETTDRIDAGDKAGLNALAEVRQGLSTQVDTHKQRMAEFETGAATQAEKDIKILSEKLNVEVKEMRSSLNEKTSTTAAKVDQKLESTLKQVADLAGNSKGAIMAIDEKIGALRTDMDERHGEGVSQLAQLRKEREEAQEKDVTSLKQMVDMKTAHIVTEQKRETQERSTAMKDIKAKVTQDIATLSTRVDEQHSTYSEMTSTQERKFTDKAAALDAMVADHHTHFSSLCGAIEQRFVDKNAAIMARAEDLGNTVNMHHHSLNSLCTSMETKTAERMQHVDRQLEATRSSFADSCAKLDTKIADQKQKLTDTVNDRVKKLSDDIQGTRTHLSERQAQDLDHFQQRVTEFEEKMRHKQLANESRVDGIIAELQTTDKKCGRLDASLTQVGNAIKDNRDTFTKMSAALEKKLEERLTTTEGSSREMRNTVTAHYTTFNSMCGDTEAKLKSVASEVTQLQMLGKDQNQRLTETMQTMDTRVKDDIRILTDSTTSVDSKLTDTKADFEAKLKGQYSHFSDLHTNMDTKMMEKTAALEARMKDADESTRDTMTAVELQSKQKDTEHDKRFSDITNLVLEKAQEATELCHKVEKQAVDYDAKGIDRVAKVEDRLREAKRELLEKHNAADKKIAETKRQQDDAAAESTDTLTRETVRLDKKASKLEQIVDDRMVSIQKSATEDRELARSTSTKLEKKLSERVGEIDTRLASTERKSASHESVLTKQTADSTKWLIQVAKLTEDSEAQILKLNELTDRVSANRQAAADSSDEIDQKYTDLFAATEDRVTKQRDAIADIRTSTEAALTAHSEALETALKGQHEHFTVAHGGLDVKFSEQGIAHGAEITALGDGLQAQNDSFTKVCEGIVEFAKEENEAQDKRAEATFKALDEAVAQTDAKFSDGMWGERGLDKRMDDLRKALTSTDEKFEGKNTAQDERVDAIHDALEALTQEVADTASQSLTASGLNASKLADATADLTGSIETGVQALNLRIDSAEAAQKAADASVRKLIEVENGERASALEAIELKSSSEDGRLDSEIVGLQQLIPVEFQKVENRIGVEVTGLGNRLDIDSERISRVVDERTHDLSTRLTNGVGSLTTQLDAADTKLSQRITAESQLLGSKLDNVNNALSTRIGNETQDLRTALKEQDSRLDAAQKESTGLLGKRVDQETSDRNQEIIDSAGRQEARSVSVEQAAEKALAESNARVERRLEESIHELKTKDSSLEAQLTSEKAQNGVAARDLGKRIDAADSAIASMDTKVDRTKMEIAQTVVTEDQKLEQKINKADAAAEARHASMQTRIMQLEADVTGKLEGKVSALEGKVTKELSPLQVTTERLGRKLEEVEDLAKRADATSQTASTKLGLQAMEIDMAMQSVKQLDERGGATEEEFSKLEQDVEVVNKEISELSMELALVGAMVEAVNPAA